MSSYIHEKGLKLRQKVRAVVIDDAGKVLLVRPHGYADHDWALVGGGVEQGENPVQAMQRELAEELGITDVPWLRRLSVTNRFIYSHDYKRKRGLDHDGQDAVMFACSVPAGVAVKVQVEELADARWFALEAALDAFPVAKQRAIFEACLAEMDPAATGKYRSAA
jgi:8-oxo-dGTP pyrophosphatase MutT (NUDIX family)